MGKKKDAENPNPSEMKEGHNLLGAPTFEQLENGRFKCVETSHELPANARDFYAVSKHCRLGLIDSALARNKPPLNMFKQDPVSRLKLKCRLTGVTINKTEEHIWKHINGKRFLNMLDKKEAENEIPNGKMEEEDDKKEKKKKKIEEEHVDEIIKEVRDSTGMNIDFEEEEEEDFWMPPDGHRWDHDDGGDRWGSDSESGPETDGDDEEDAGEEDEDAMGTEEATHETAEISKRTKRMSLEIGPSSFATRKKKKKTEATAKTGT